jgi:hypothetical protein
MNLRARVGRLLVSLQAIELGLELFTGVYVVDAGREPDVIERKSVIGVS